MRVFSSHTISLKYKYPTVLYALSDRLSDFGYIKSIMEMGQLLHQFTSLPSKVMLCLLGLFKPIESQHGWTEEEGQKEQE